MSNYPAGAEYDKNAPYNREERLQGETIGLFEYLENLEMPYAIRCEFQSFRTKLRISRDTLEVFKDKDRPANNKLVNLLQKHLSEPEIFIENE
jgi:hypothetical protein